jgi:hypothetical protein
MTTKAYYPELFQTMASTVTATAARSDGTLSGFRKVRMRDLCLVPPRGGRVGWGGALSWWCIVGCLMLTNLTSCRTTVGQVIGQQFFSPVYAFEMPLPGEAWQAVADKPSVLTLTHTHLAAGITISVTCDHERDVPLDILTRHLFFGFKHMEVLQQTPQALNGVPTLETVGRAHLDGREVQLHSYVARRNGCIYDMVYFASPQDYPHGAPSFRRMMAGFRFLQR